MLEVTTKMMARPFMSICAVCLCCLPMFARTQQTVEQAAANWLASLVRSFMVRNDGARPTNWEQLELEGELTKMNEWLSIKRAEAFPVQAHYVFLPMDRLVDRSGAVVLIQTSSLKKDGDGCRNGRWLIVTKSRDVSAQWRPENEVEAMLAKLEKGLPRVDSNDVQVARKKVRASVAAKQADQAATERVLEEMSRNLPAAERRKSFFGTLGGVSMTAAR